MERSAELRKYIGDDWGMLYNLWIIYTYLFLQTIFFFSKEKIETFKNLYNTLILNLALLFGSRNIRRNIKY